MVKKIAKKSKATTVKKSKASSAQKSKHTIPAKVKIEKLKDYLLNADESEEKEIIDYVEWQCSKDNEVVKHLEKVKTEYIFGQPMDAWDVKTNKTKFWVITSPTNLYSQKLFPSLDYTFSFHIGVTTRLHQRSMTQPQLEIHSEVEELFNKIAMIRERFFKATTIDDFQEIGVKCRECLLLLIRKIADDKMIQKNGEIPQKGNFILWSEIIARVYFPGSSKERIRAHFKEISKSTWQITNWLTHSHSSDKNDASIVLNATEHIVELFLESKANSHNKNSH